MPKLFNGSNPKLKCFITACIFVTLGIPLIIYSIRAPPTRTGFEVFEDLVTQKGGEALLNKLLSYPSDALLTIKVDLFQKLVCMGETFVAKHQESPMPVNPKCSKLIQNYINKLKKNKCEFGGGGDKKCCPDGTLVNNNWSNCDHTADEINTLRMASLVIGILLLCFAALKLIEIFFH